MAERRSRKDDAEDTPEGISLQATLRVLIGHVVAIAKRIDPDDPEIEINIEALEELAVTLESD